jgi:hypothetical protein
MILIGDWAPGQKYGELYLGQEFILGNLEGPVLPPDHGLLPVPKAGPSVYAVSLPEGGRPIVWAMANNHTMDYGVLGLDTTLAALQCRGFKMAGAGKNISAARSPVIVSDDGVRIGIISCCEAQFGVATDRKAGVAEFGPWMYRAISHLKSEVDAVVVSVHAAVEVSPWPSPRLQAFYRSLIDAGASVIHGHHAHVPQGVEEYQGGVIAYGLGNFVVDPDIWCEKPNSLWSLGITVDFKTSPPKSSTVTFEIREDKHDSIYAQESTDKEKSSHKKYIERCNNPLTDPTLLEGLWQETSLRTFFHHTAGYLGFEKTGKRDYFQLIWNALRNSVRKAPSTKSQKPLSKQVYLLRYVMFACASHQDSLRTALGLLSGELEDMRTDETRRLADEMMPWSVGIVPV